MRVLYHTPRPRLAEEREGAPVYASLDQLLAESDVISLHCPLNDETFHLIDRDALNTMKPDAILVNTARGTLIDTRALVEVLRQRPIIAALDVTDPEPLPADHLLLALPNAIVTPHVASASVATRTRMALMAVEDLLAGLRGDRPRYLVNPEAWQERMISVGEAQGIGQDSPIREATRRKRSPWPRGHQVLGSWFLVLGSWFLVLESYLRMLT